MSDTQIVPRTETLPVSTQDPMRLIELAIQQNADVDKLERLMALAERWNATQAKAAFEVAMAQCQSEIPIIQPNARNEQTKSVYADLEAMARIITPIYTKHGFNLSFGTDKSEMEGCIRITVEVSHNAGHSKTAHLDLPLDIAGFKGTPNKTVIHGHVSSMSYGQRYLTKLVFNVAIAGEDKDGNQQASFITEQQAADLRALADEVKANVPKFLQYLKAESFETIPSVKFHDAVQALETKRKQKPKEAA